MKNRYGVEYTFVKYDDKLYRFNMSEEGMKYSRYGGKEDQEGIDPMTILVSLIQAVGHLLLSEVKYIGMRLTKALNKSR
jgi:hypothetical protein